MPGNADRPVRWNYRRFALQTILLDTFLTLEDLRLRSVLAIRKKMDRLKHQESKAR